jgi:uncharacterized protein
MRTIVIRFSLCVAALVLLTVGCSRDEGLPEDATTLLHWAAQEGNQAVLAELLTRDLPVDRVDGRGRTAAAVAAEAGKGEAVLMLLNAGADPGATLSDGRTLLHWAAGNGDLPALEAILDAEAATLLERQDAQGLTAVERAAWANQPEAVLLLLEYGAAADRYWVSGRGILRRLLE